MVDRLVSTWLRYLGGVPAFRIYGRSRQEPNWRMLDVYATPRRDSDSRWPLWSGVCITWTSEVIAVGWDFAEEVLREQVTEPASRENPIAVSGGRIRDLQRRLDAGAEPWASASEILAHECGHTRQVQRLGIAYWPVVGSVTLFREGPHFWNYFENQASEEGQFGGIVNGSVRSELMDRMRS
jgi:hypothetical protein